VILFIVLKNLTFSSISKFTSHAVLKKTQNKAKTKIRENGGMNFSLFEKW
jgi:hypothetical protein